MVKRKDRSPDHEPGVPPEPEPTEPPTGPGIPPQPEPGPPPGEPPPEPRPPRPGEPIPRQDRGLVDPRHLNPAPAFRDRRERTWRSATCAAMTTTRRSP